MPPKGFREGFKPNPKPFQGGGGLKPETRQGFRFGLKGDLNPPLNLLLNQTWNPFGFQTEKFKPNPKPFRVSDGGV